MSLAPRISKLDRNYIINGGFDFWQRVAGNTLTVNDASGGNSWAADRFIIGRSGTTVKNFGLVRQTDVPTVAQAGCQLAYSGSIGVNVAIPSPAATDIACPFQYRIEGNDYRHLHGKIVTISFWLKVFHAGAFPVQVPVAIGGANHTRSYVTSVQQNAANVWQFHSVTLQLESTGAYNFDTATGLKISIGTMAGSSVTTSTLNQWQAGDFFAPVGAFNFMSATSNGYRLTGLSLVEGAVAPQGQFTRAGATIGEELRLCQRYFEKGGLSTDVAIGTAGQIAFTAPDILGQFYAHTEFKVEKRIQPTVTSYHAATGTANQVRNANGGGTIAASYSGVTTTSFTTQGPLPAGATLIQFSWTADAEL